VRCLYGNELCGVDMSVCGVACVKQWGRLVFSPKRACFAQARIAESLPWCCSSISLRRPKLVLSDALSRSGENGSPKRVLEESQCTLLASSFRRGVLYFWANDNLAQASWTRPSEDSQSATIPGLA